ncbi:MAG TPA: DUF4268 domain-containing protein [Candidatus Dormibacteraeota bacterium]|nr:DUF4268 domain-containing protein [Candidatus Dormibacteraeota bacterium]
MKAGETTLNELIVRGDRQYQVPLYQRPYTWGQENWKQLWADLLDQYYVLKRGSQPSRQSAHFFGSFVLAPFNISARSAPNFLVVDGQQRLTTVFLLLAALRDSATAGDAGEYGRYQGVLVNERARRDEDRPRLVPTQSDRLAFQSVIEGHPQDAGDSKIAQTYRYFVAQLAKEDEDGDQLDTERMQRVVLDRLAVVEITADRDDNPHRIFESLNARGVPLTQADLLRNYIFMLLPTRGERVYHDVWLPMQEALGPDHMVGLARVDLQRRGVDANLGDVYRLQQDRLSALADNEAALEVEVRDLALRAQYYRCFVEPLIEPDPELRGSLERLRQWGAQTTYPLLMHLYSLRGEGRATVEQLRHCLSFIESFLVRRQLVGVPTNQLNRLFADSVRQLNPDLPVDDALRELLSRERRYWPTDEQLRLAVRTRNFYFAGRAPQRMVILERLEQSFDHKEPVDLKAARPSVEHVMPQTLTDEWRQHLAQHGEDPTSVHAQLLHTLGNLTLSAYNTELSNNVFDRKQQMYSTSHFELNKALAESPNWTSKEILARADDLANRAIKTWPGPLSTGEGAPETTDWGRVDAAIALIPPDCTCSVAELAQLVPASPEALLARLRARSTQHNLDNVLDENGQPLVEVHTHDATKQAGRRAITAYELAQFMPFEFDDDELKVLRRKRSLGAERRRRGSIDVEGLTAFLRASVGRDVATLRAIGKRVYEQRGTQQEPVDWSDPDKWIPERLAGLEMEAALDIWERSGKTLNPRYLSRKIAAIERLRLASVTEGKYLPTERGRTLLRGDLSILESAPEAGSERSRAETFQKFWELFLERARAAGSRFARAQAQRIHWIRASAGMRGLGYNVAIRRYDTSVELYIDTASREQNIQFLEELREHQTEIESVFGGALEWVVKPDQRAMRVACDLDTDGYVDVESLADIADELLDGFTRFESALQPFIDPMLPERPFRSGWQPKSEPWTEEEFLAAVQALASDNAGPAGAILTWAHSDPRVTVEGGWGPQNAGIRVRTARHGDPTSEHSFLNLYANSADNASAEVQFASMARREPFSERGKRVQLLNELSAISTSTWDEDDINKRVAFRLRDLRDPQHLERFIGIWRSYVDEFHSVDYTEGDAESAEERLIPAGAEEEE